MSRLSVLMTVYNEAEFIEYAVRACLPHVDDLVIVEGAYQETIALGASPRSTDGTYEFLANVRDLEAVRKLFGLGFTEEDEKKTMDLYCKISPPIHANEQTDKDQRNVGLEKIKELNPDGWCLIIDGDEVYDKNNLAMVRVAMKNMDKSHKYAAYFKSLTFVNGLDNYTEQEFPRLFKITPKCLFINDNAMEWPDKGLGWQFPHVFKIPYIKYHHYAFAKGIERFELKKKWWETRFGKDFDYGWYVSEEGKIDDPNHEIYEYTGKHPEIMKDYGKKCIK